MESPPYDQQKTEEEFTLVEHLTDLRKVLIKSAIIFLIFFFIVFFSINFWFPLVTRGHELVILGPLEIIKFYMSTSTALALGMALPFILMFFWSFLKPGLVERETKFISLYSPVMLLLFFTGIAFGYFVVNPLSYNFLIGYGAANFDIMVSAQQYISFLLMTVVPIGIMFELPLVVLFLANMELLTADMMKKVRGYSYLGMAVVSAVITPPDLISQMLIMIPMILLYEISISLVRRIERKKSRVTAEV